MGTETHIYLGTGYINAILAILSHHDAESIEYL
jgi:hypothetical protein